MGAFFSSTDDAHENNTQFYGVWGKVADAHPEFAFRYVVGDDKIECDPSVLIDWPTCVKQTVKTVKETITVIGDTDLVDAELNGSSQTRELEPVITHSEPDLLKGPFKRIPYSDGWMGQHTKKVYAATKTARTKVYDSWWERENGRTTTTSPKNFEQTSFFDEENADFEAWSNYRRNYGQGYSKEAASEAFDDFFSVSTLEGNPVPADVSDFLRNVSKELLMDYGNIHNFIDYEERRF